MLALTASEAIWSLFALVLLGIIYLAVAISKLRERLARMEGREQRRQNDFDAER